MQGSYIPRHVANALILEGPRFGHRTTHMRVQKLLYILQGFSLALYDKPALSESFAAWPFGPALESVFADLSKWGDERITSMIPEPSLLHRRIEQGFLPVCTDGDFWNLLHRVLQSYRDWSDVKLGALANGELSAWRAVVPKDQEGDRAPCGPVKLLDNDRIRHHFRQAIQAA